MLNGWIKEIKSNANLINFMFRKVNRALMVLVEVVNRFMLVATVTNICLAMEWRFGDGILLNSMFL